MNKKILSILLIVTFTFILTGCDPDRSSDEKQRIQQEQILKQGTDSVGMPAIKNFKVKRTLKDIQEMLDQEGLITYAYTWSDYHANFVYIGEGIGYPIPYSTQYTNPHKCIEGHAIIDQADPSGVFPENSSEATWYTMKNPNSKEVKPVYIEQRINVFPHKLPNAIYPGGYGQP